MNIEIINEGTDWESIRLKGKWSSLYIESKDSSGDVEINSVEGSSSTTFILTQDNIKDVILFLQKQII